MRMLYITAVGLIVLAAISWAFATPALSLPIAAVKAIWIGWIFMELDRAHVVPRTIAIVTILFIALMLGGTLADVSFRG